MQRLAALVILLSMPSAAAADYSPPPVNDLVLGSDAIVTGEIVSLTADTFRLRVAEVVVGSPTAGASIEVERFVDWTCAARWSAYAVGQRALFFLRAGPSGRWQIRSGGGEGEMPIVNGRVHVDGYYARLAPSGVNGYARMTVHGGSYVGFTLELRAFVSALREVRACFAADVAGPYHRLGAVRTTCSAGRQSALGQTPIGAALIAALRP